MDFRRASLLLIILIGLVSVCSSIPISDENDADQDASFSEDSAMVAVDDGHHEDELESSALLSEADNDSEISDSVVKTEALESEDQESNELDDSGDVFELEALIAESDAVSSINPQNVTTLNELPKPLQEALNRTKLVNIEEELLRAGPPVVRRLRKNGARTNTGKKGKGLKVGKARKILKKQKKQKKKIQKKVKKAKKKVRKELGKKAKKGKKAQKKKKKAQLGLRGDCLV